MENRKIPDVSIKASSHRFQHPPRHGRLGGDNYWCSEEGVANFIQIDLPKKYKITGAKIQLQGQYKIKVIILKGQIFKEWLNFHHEKVKLALSFVENGNYVFLKNENEIIINEKKYE